MTKKKSVVYPIDDDLDDLEASAPSTAHRSSDEYRPPLKYMSGHDLKHLKRTKSAFVLSDFRSEDGDSEQRKTSSVMRAVGRRLFSIRVIFMAVVVLMIVAAAVSAWYLSWSNGQAAVSDITDKYRSSMLERVRDRLSRKFTELRDLATIDRDYWTDQGHSIDSISSIYKFTDSLWAPQLKITEESIPRTQTIYSHTTGWAVILNTVGSTSSFMWSIVNPAWGGNLLAGYPFVAALPQKGRELPNITQIPFSPLALNGVRDYVLSPNPPSSDMVMGSLEQTGVPGVFAFGLYQPAVWLIRNSSTHQVVGFGSKSISTDELQLFLQSISDIPNTYSFIADRADGQLIAASNDLIYSIGTNSVGMPAYHRLAPGASSARQIRDGANELLRRYGSLKNVPANTQFLLDSDEQYYVGATVFRFFEMEWLIVVMVPRDAIMGPIDIANRNTLITVICIIFASVVLAMILTHFVAKPLDRLGHQMIEISQLRFPSDEEARRLTFHEISKLQSSFDSMQKGIRAFSQYVPANLVRQILKTHAAIGLGMDTTDLTVLFCDVKGFTTLSEALPPDQLVEVMSEFLEEFSSIIQHNGGTIDKYIGDCIMAFFNAPEPVDRHARCAITAVQQCMRRLTDLQDNWRQRGLPELDCRIGLHTGQALCGNFGSKSRFNFTVIGDTVNLASRLESLCKQFGVQTLFSAECVFEAGDLPGAMVRPLGKVQVVGKQQATAIFSIINLPAAPTETRMQMRDLFIQAMRLFRGHDFDQCVQVLSAYSRLHNLYSVTEDKPSRIYLDLCHRCMVNGVAPDWDCVLIMDEK